MGKRVPLTRAEKERLVIELFEKGMNIRDIAKRVHMSFGDIGLITRKFSGVDDPQISKKSSKHSQALELFQRGNTKVEVAIKLGLSDSETIAEYKQFMVLKGFDGFCEFYDQTRGDIGSYKLLDQELKSAGLGVSDAIEGIKVARELDQMRIVYKGLQSHGQQLRQEHSDISGVVLILKKERDAFVNEIAALNRTRNNLYTNEGTLQSNTEMAPNRIRRRHMKHTVQRPLI